ncbi:hypothetical protein GCM10009527_065900 [Actinomadura nitritigenes]|uniref:Uncharacterized protein n=1 Tax=Actinomadura nitritigenes TaxID=134602 RepID=A0ABS3R1I2_9ACTN|nr:hypothetical protein [Actinomadura nitritigenes]MBO2440095.1 hypothetical protein [Actinomadura nitritigenes]
MGYPGDQGRPGGRPPGPSPQAPYGSGAEAPPYGNDNDETSAPHGEASGARPFGGESFGTGPLEADPFGTGPLEAEPFAAPSSAAEPPGAPGGPTAAWGEPPAQGGQDAFPPGDFGSAGHDRFGQDQFGQQQFGHEPFGQQQFGQEQFGQPPGEFGQGDPGGDPYGAPMPGGYQQGDFDGAPPGPSGEDGPSGRRRSLPLIIGGAVVAGLVLIGGGVGVASMMKDDSKPAKKAPPAAASTKPTAPASPTVPPLQAVKLQSRATDPVKLTLSEVFGKASFKASGLKYVRTAANSTTKCSAVVGGVALEKALKKGDCTQALRATYALSSGSLIGTIGVLNLKSADAAKAALKAASAKDAFLLALPGKGVTKKAGKGLAFGTSQARGHYLVMTWVQRPDGKAIAAKYHKAVSVFGAELYKGSDLAFALHYRETEGKPLKK